MTGIIILVLLIFIIILFLVILAIFGLYIFDIFLPAPFVSTKKDVVERMIKLAEIKPGDKVFDLGSGDGRLLIAAANRGAAATGVEKNPFLVLLSRIKIKIARVNAKVFYRDVMDLNLTEADIVFLYLNPKVLAKISPKLKQELKTAAKIISNTYKIPGWKIVKNFDNVFLYKI